MLLKKQTFHFHKLNLSYFSQTKGRNLVERTDNQSSCKTKIYKSLVSVHTTVDFKCSIAESLYDSVI